MSAEVRAAASGEVLDLCARVRQLADRERMQLARIDEVGKAMRLDLERIHAELWGELGDLHDAVEAAHAEGRWEDRDRLLAVLLEVDPR